MKILLFLLIPILLFGQFQRFPKFDNFIPQEETTYFLDTYGDSVYAAYSFRLLNTAWKDSNCITVERSSDNNTQDIGFLNGIIDTASIISFCGAATGYIQDLYDQSGNGHHLSQTTDANEFIIYNAGVMIKDGEQVAADLTGDYMDCASFEGLDMRFSTFIVASSDQAEAVEGIFEVHQGGATNNRISHYFDTQAVATPARIGNYAPDGVSRNHTQDVELSATTQYLISTICDNTNWWGYINGSAQDTLDVSGVDATNINTLRLGRQTAGSLTHDGKWQELIIYNAVKTDDREAIETNINTFYSIY